MVTDKGQPRRWVPLATMLLSLVGLALSAYLTYEHFTQSKTLSCPNTGAIDCLSVTKSDYATPFGISVALLGLLYFVVVTALNLPAAWRRPALDLPRLVLLGVGVLMVLWLVYVELFLVDAICLWCTAVHVVTLVLFGIALLAGDREPEAP